MWIKVALAYSSLAAMLQTTQQQQWTAETPPEFSDYSTSTELEILNQPEFQDYPIIEVGPVTNPNPGTNPGTGTDPGTDPGTNPGTNPGTGTDPGTGSDPGAGTDPWAPPSDYSPFFFANLKNYFPFCLPFDAVNLLHAFKAEPVTPSWDFSFDCGELGVVEFSVDLSFLDGFAQIARTFQVAVFCVCLAAGSKRLLGW